MPATTTIGGFVVSQTVIVAQLATATEAANGVLATVTVPGDARILDVILDVTDMDSGAAGLVDVGDTSDDNRFIASFSIQVAGTIRASDSAGLLEGTYLYSTVGDQDIQVTVNTVSTTGLTGTVELTVVYTRL